MVYSVLLFIPSGLWPASVRQILFDVILLAFAIRSAPARHCPRRHRTVVAGASIHDGSGITAKPPKVKPAWVRDEVLRLAVFLPSCRGVADAFNAIHRRRASVGKTWVNAVMRDGADEIARQRRQMRGKLPHSVRVRQRWSLDLTSVSGRDRRRDRHLIRGIVDQGSRKVLSLKVLAFKRTWTLLGQVCLAITEHGCPAAIRTDNKAMFTGRLWRIAMRWAGIRRERIPPMSPWCNGRIERFFGTLKPILRRIAWRGDVGLQAALGEFADFYNAARVHQALDGLTPAQAWRGMTLADARRSVQGRWVQAFDGVLLAYQVRC